MMLCVVYFPGDFLECDAICNKPVGDPAYGQVKPSKCGHNLNSNCSTGIVSKARVAYFLVAYKIVNQNKVKMIEELFHTSLYTLFLHKEP